MFRPVFWPVFFTVFRPIFLIFFDQFFAVFRRLALPSPGEYALDEMQRIQGETRAALEGTFRTYRTRVKPYFRAEENPITQGRR